MTETSVARRQRPDGQEGGRDGDECHQQRHDRHPRGEDESEHQQRAAAGDQGFDGEARCRRLPPSAAPARSASRPVICTGAPPTVMPSTACCAARASSWPGIDPARGGDVDEREGGPAVLRRRRSGHASRRRTRRASCGTAALIFCSAAARSAWTPGRVDRLARWQRDDRHERSGVAAVAVGLDDLAVGDEAFLARDVELLLEASGRRAPSRRRRRRRARPRGRRRASCDSRTQLVRVVIAIALGHRVRPLSIQRDLRCKPMPVIDTLTA